MAGRVSRVVGLFRFHPASVGEGGQMSLADHLRELRTRLLLVVLALFVATCITWFFYDQLFQVIFRPYRLAAEQLDGEVDTTPVITGAATGLLLQLKLSALAAVVLVSPFWLYQVWAFIVPGLHANERKWTRVFAVVAGPLFMAGVAVGYYVLPKGLEVLIGFTPSETENLIEFGDYFTFLVRMLLVFGIAFEIPLFVVMLNLAGCAAGVRAAQAPALDRHRDLRVRRGGHPVHGPLLDADARDPRAAPAHGLRADRTARRRAPCRQAAQRPGHDEPAPVSR